MVKIYCVEVKSVYNDDKCFIKYISQVYCYRDFYVSFNDS